MQVPQPGYAKVGGFSPVIRAAAQESSVGGQDRRSPLRLGGLGPVIRAAHQGALATAGAPGLTQGVIAPTRPKYAHLHPPTVV